MSYDLDDAMIASEVYSDSIKQETYIGNTAWYVVAVAPPNLTGYQGAVLYNTETKQVVVANRGTDSLIDGLIDVDMGLSQIPSQLDYARNMLAKATAFAVANGLNPGDIKIVGHSLGGSLSQIMGAETGLKTVTFNAYGVGNMVGKDNGTGNYSNIQNNVMSGDWVHSLPGSKMLGTTIQYEGNLEKQLKARGNVSYASPLFALAAHGSARMNDGEIADQEGKVVTIDVSNTIALPLIANRKMIGALAKAFELSAKAVNKFFDPLAVDLNRDGVVSTINIDSGVNFDLDKNGFAESSGWIASSDGIVVRDINGNGLIDDGGELFGDQTLLPNGSVASGAFQAISSLDSDSDGKVDVNDENWSSLMVWQDKNSDGYTEPGELRSMVDAGVKAISLNFNNSNIPDENGNFVVQQGSFVRTDNSIGVANGFSLNRDTTNTIETTILDAPTNISALPNIAGFGNIYDLQQAMIRDQLLAEMVSAATQISDFSVLSQSFDAVLRQWAGASSVATGSRGGFVDAQHLATLERFYGQAFIGADGSSNPQSGAGVILEKAYSELEQSLLGQFVAQAQLKTFWDAVSFELNKNTNSIDPDFSSAVPVLNGIISSNSYKSNITMLALLAGSIKNFGLDASDSFATLKQSFANSPLGYDRALAAGLFGNQFVFDTANLNANISVTELASMNGSSFSGHWGNDVLLGQHGNDDFNGGSGDDILDGGAGNDRLIGGLGADTYIFGRGYGQDVISNEGETVAGQDTLKLGVGLAPSDLILVRTGFDLTISINGTSDKAIVANYFNGNAVPVSKLLFADGTTWGATEIAANLSTVGTDNADWIYGIANQSNLIHGLSGNDSLYGGNLADTIFGDAGNDTIDGTAGNDVLIGGAGNDTLIGNTGSDIYIFNRGDGQDVINNYASDTGTASATDTLRFGAGITASDIEISRSGNDLVLAIKGTTDTVTIYTHFYDKTRSLSQVVFADGTTWSQNDLAMKAVFNGTANTDYMYGAPGVSNNMNGQGGNDYLYGADKADTLNGGTGNDTLDGKDGNDTIIGGSGSDVLIGNSGSDTYVFNLGDGQDTINNYATDTGNAGVIDTLSFGQGISASNITLSRSGNDLVLSINGTNDSVTIYTHFYDKTRALTQITFADGTVWDQNYLASNAVFNGTANSDYMYGAGGVSNNMNGQGGNDYLYGADQADTLNGGAGNDTISGGAGNDQLIGGVGNDVMNGGIGSDTYLLNRGDGADFVDNTTYDTSTGKQDRIVFGAGINSDQLWFKQNGINLEIDIIGTSDSVLVGNWFQNSAYHVQQIVAGDGKVLADTQVQQLVSAMAAFAPPSAGQTTLPAEYQTALAPTLAANWK